MKTIFYFILKLLAKCFVETEEDGLDFIQNGQSTKQHRDFMSNLFQENEDNFMREHQREQEQFMHQNDLTQQMNDMNGMNDFPF